MIKERILKLVLQNHWVVIIGGGLPNVVFMDSVEIFSYEEGEIWLSDSTMLVCSQRSKLSIKNIFERFHSLLSFIQQFSKRVAIIGGLPKRYKRYPAD